MPATRAVASTLPFAMDCDSISLSVSFCSRTSPRATASRSCTGFAETSTMRASPFVPICVSRFISRCSRHKKAQKTQNRNANRACLFVLFAPFRGQKNSNGLLPLLNRRAHLIGGVQARLHKLRREPRKSSQQIGRHQNLPVAVRPGTDADGWHGNFLRDLPCDRRRDEVQHDRKRSRIRQRLRVGQQGFTLGFHFAFDVIATFLAHTLRQ